MSRSITLSHSRPMGQITVIVVEREFDIEITRSSVGFFEQAPLTLSVSHTFDQAVAQLTAWCEGELVQVALSDWSLEDREWLITGIAPGDDLNPLHH